MSELKKGMELKARTARSIADEEEMLELGADCPIEPTQVYIKSEADKVIAHHKYKRCFAMAKWCDSEMNYWYDRIEIEQCQRFKFYDKWYQRWLELAKKFKETK